MLPDLKVQLIEELQNTGYVVGMCGDGANDCGALKTANTGISLSTAEASVASPFTATQQDIRCVSTLIREGRCALVTSFALFKHLLAYAWIMCVDVLILYTISGQMTDTQYLYLDFFVPLYPALLFGNIDAYPALDRVPPPTHLVALEPILSLMSFIGIQSVVMVAAWLSLFQQPWFEPWHFGSLGHKDVLSYENSLVFHIMGLSLLWSSVVFCRGPPYRKNMFTSKLFVVSWVVILFCGTYLMIDPPQFAQKVLTLKVFPGQGFLWLLYGVSITSFIFCLVYEDFILNRVLHRLVLPAVKERFNYKPDFKKLDDELREDKNWPPTGSSRLSVRESQREVESASLLESEDEVEV